MAGGRGPHRQIPAIRSLSGGPREVSQAAARRIPIPGIPYVCHRTTPQCVPTRCRPNPSTVSIGRIRYIAQSKKCLPNAQLTFTDVDGHRITAFITDTPVGVVPGQLAGLDLRHRQHARVEDRIRQAKATGMRNFPCNGFAANSAWLEIVMTAMDLVAWSKLLGFADQPDLARCEIATFRYRVLHVAARISHSARQTRLRIDQTWRWAEQITQAWHQIRTAFT
jgi:hypothetical protein